MSMFNDIVWDAKGNEEICENNSKKIEEYAQRFLAVIGLSLDLVQRTWFREEVVRHIQWQTKRMLGSDSGENDAKFPKIWSPNINEGFPRM